MTNEGDKTETMLSPDEAFNVLGNTTRVRILKTLGEADGSLSFAELRDKVGHDDPGNFNYHLSKLEGHFVRKTDEGYELQSAGERVIEAVLSGAMTETPVLEPTQTDIICHHCGAP
ncbi:MAG: helix-turn-helix domain-containing protein, partial [Halobacteria archaeon]|nr:helix-turn-helix domain-containing protein [Halobacteria archaeon]